jgi:hypothetical protein
MGYRETFWMACDSVESDRVERGPFSTREEAEREARVLDFAYLLRYEHIVDDVGDIEDVRSVFIELPRAPSPHPSRLPSWHTRCATCGESCVHDLSWQAEVWSDIHEFEHSRHFVRLFQHLPGDDLREIVGWRQAR